MEKNELLIRINAQKEDKKKEKSEFVIENELPDGVEDLFDDDNSDDDEL